MLIQDKYTKCTNYDTVPRAIQQIFSEILKICNLFYEPLGEWNNSKIMRNEGNTCRIAGSIRAITS